jgi:hypothetical protein
MYKSLFFTIVNVLTALALAAIVVFELMEMKFYGML